MLVGQVGQLWLLAARPMRLQPSQLHERERLYSLYQTRRVSRAEPNKNLTKKDKTDHKDELDAWLILTKPIRPFRSVAPKPIRPVRPVRPIRSVAA